MRCGYTDETWAKMTREQQLNALVAELECLRADTARERDYYKDMILRHAADVKPLVDVLQWKIKQFPAPPPDQPRKSKLFGILDMFLVAASGLPDAAALKRTDALVAGHTQVGANQTAS